MKNTKYIIVGQGIAGTLVAWELYKRGIDFVVIASSKIPSSTKIAGGLINPIVFRTIKKSWMFDEFYPAMCNTYAELEDVLSCKFFHTLSSKKIISNNEVILYQEASKGTLGICLASPVIDITIDGVADKRNYVEIYQSGWLDGELLMHCFTNFLKERNVLYLDELNYSKILVNDGNITVNELVAEKIIFCEGANIVHNPWFGNAGTAINKGELMEVEIPELKIDSVLRSDLFILPTGDNKFKIGATFSHGILDSLPSNEGLQQLENKLQKLLNVPYVVTNQWAGLRPATRDRKPILGNYPGINSLVVFNGLGSKGFLQAPFWANHLVEWLLGSTQNLHKQVDVQRFFNKTNG